MWWIIIGAVLAIVVMVHTSYLLWQGNGNRS